VNSGSLKEGGVFLNQLDTYQSGKTLYSGIVSNYTSRLAEFM